MEQREDDQGKEPTTHHHLLYGISLGLAIGVAIGAAMGSIALGVGVGLSLGVAIGLALERKRRTGSGDD